MMRFLRYAGMAMVVIVVASCSLFDYSSLEGKKYALVYGVTNYTYTVHSGATSPNLSYPAADAKSMVTTLAAAGYTIYKARWVDGSGNVYVQDTSTYTTATSVGSIGSPQIDASGTYSDSGSGIAQAPTQSTIESDIAGMKSVLGANDTLVVYFSGHGTQDTSVSPTREYFDPYGSVAYYTAYGDYYADVDRAVRDDELGSYFSALPTSRRILILDTCDSGGFIGNSLEVDATSETVTDSTTGTITAVTVSPVDILTKAIANYASYSASSTGLSAYNAQVLAAAGKDESSYETSSLGGGHGVMTYYLLQAASNGDLNGDGKVTLTEAYCYAKAGIDEGWNASSSVKAAGETFEPHISGGSVDYVVF